VSSAQSDATLTEFGDALRHGRDGAGPLRSPEPGAEPWNMRFTTAAQVRDYVPTDYFQPKEADMLDRFAQFAVIAAREAATQSGIEWTPELRENTAVVTGSCIGGQTTRIRASLKSTSGGVRGHIR